MIKLNKNKKLKMHDLPVVDISKGTLKEEDLVKAFKDVDDSDKKNLQTYYWSSTTLMSIEADSPEQAKEIAMESIESQIKYERGTWTNLIEKVEPALDHIDCQNKTNEAFMRDVKSKT